MNNSIPNPCYVLEESRLRHNLQIIKTVAEEANVEIILAFKAFALWKSFCIFREYIQGTTASSPYEARLAYEEFGTRTHTYSPAYEDETFIEILRTSSHIVFNSWNQYSHFREEVHHFVQQNKDRRKECGVSIGLRVNPEYSEIETLLYNPCAVGSRFGMLAKDLPTDLPDDVEGFHIHCHCESGADTFQRTLQHIEEKFSHWFPQLKWINFGGGHLMTREGYDRTLMVNTLHEFHKHYPWLHIILEPGSAFLWNTGCLYARVIDIVENESIKTAILNVSFTCHMPDCLEMPYMPTVLGAELVGAECQREATVFRLGGNSCLSGDWLGQWRFARPLKVGTQIIFADMIHYTTVKTTMFNGIQHPSLGMLHEDGSFELYRRFCYEDYRNRMD